MTTENHSERSPDFEGIRDKRFQPKECIFLFRFGCGDAEHCYLLLKGAIRREVGMIKNWSNLEGFVFDGRLYWKRNAMWNDCSPMNEPSVEFLHDETCFHFLSKVLG